MGPVAAMRALQVLQLRTAILGVLEPNALLPVWEVLCSNLCPATGYHDKEVLS